MNHGRIGMIVFAWERVVWQTRNLVSWEREEEMVPGFSLVLFIWSRWSLELPSMNFPLTFVSPPIPLIWVQVYVSLHPSVLTDLIVKTNMWLFDPLLPPTVVQPLIPCLFFFLFLSLICKSYTDIITNDYFRSVGQCLIVIFLKSINLANVYTVFHWHNLQLSLFFANR